MDRHYIEVPGPETHELPPLLIRSAKGEWTRELLVEKAADIVDTEEMVAGEDAGAAVEALAQRRLDLALHLTDRYLGLLLHWAWGDSVLEWIRQCETTFAATSALRPLLSPDIWPHAARSSFVDLLQDKGVGPAPVGLESAVGTRLTFRHPPPIDCCTDQFLFFLNGHLSGEAYQTWARMSPRAGAHLPPERFHFEVHDLASLH